MTTDPTALPKAETPAEIVAEMRRDLIGEEYEVAPHPVILWRLWHGEGPGLEGHMSIAIPEHIAEYADRLEAAHAREMAERYAIMHQQGLAIGELESENLALKAEVERLRRERRDCPHCGGPGTFPKFEALP